MGEMNKDRRIFFRYPRHSAFNLKIDNRQVEASMTDYSLTGISAEMDAKNAVKLGDDINIDVPGSSLHFKGKVVRTDRMNGHIKVGILRLSAIEGSIEDFRVSDTLIGLSRSGKTGILTLTSGDVKKSVYIQHGDFIFAMSNQPEDRMGDLMLKEKKITKEQYDRSSEVVIKTKKRHGTVLVEMGIIKPQDLVMAVKHYVEHIIVSLFNFRKGVFSFSEAPLPTEEVITLRLSAATLIYHGTKLMTDIRQIEEDVPNGSAAIGFSRNPFDLFQDVKYDEGDKKLLSLIDGKRTIDEIASILKWPREGFLRSIYSLLSTRVIEPAEHHEPFSDITHEDIITEHESSVPSEFEEKIEEMSELYDTQGYYGVLGLRDTATTDEIKSAYYKMAKEFHPDKHFYLPQEMKGKLNQIFSYITAGYSTLIRPDSRKQYDLSFTKRKFSNAETARSSFGAGMAYYKKGMFDEAVRSFAEAAYYDGSESKYHFFYGLSQAKIAKYKQAEKNMAKAIEMDQKNPEYMAEIGHVYLALGLQLRAKKYFERALEIKPTLERAGIGMARIKELEEEA